MPLMLRGPSNPAREMVLGVARPFFLCYGEKKGLMRMKKIVIVCGVVLFLGFLSFAVWKGCQPQPPYERWIKAMQAQQAIEDARIASGRMSRTIPIVQIADAQMATPKGYIFWGYYKGIDVYVENNKPILPDMDSSIFFHHLRWKDGTVFLFATLKANDSGYLRARFYEGKVLIEDDAFYSIEKNVETKIQIDAPISSSFNRVLLSFKPDY